MAQDFIQLPADSTGKKLATDTWAQGGNTVNGQNVVLYAADGTPLLTNGRIPVENAPDPVAATTGSITASGQSVTATLPDTEVAEAHFDFSGTFTGSTAITFEVTYDGTNWRAAQNNFENSVNSNIGTAYTGSVYGFGVQTIVVSCLGAIGVRARCTAFNAGDNVAVRIVPSRSTSLVRQIQFAQVSGAVGAGAAPTAPPVYVAGSDGGNTRQLFLSTKGAAPSGTPYALLSQQYHNAGRTNVHFWATAAAAGTTTTETAITLTKSGSPGAATSSAASFVVTSGKRFRIIRAVFGSRGHLTQTAQITNFTIRVNTGGAVTTTSNAWMTVGTATPATSLAWDRADLGVDEGMEVVGDGTLQIGITANATYTTNAPTWYVSIVGFEY